MKREKKVEGKVRVKVVILMVMMMVMMGCNSGGVGGGEEGKNKFLQSLVNVSNEFLNVFTSFGEMVGSVLGFNVNSKKSDVGNYFKKVQGTVQGTKDKLEQIVADMKKVGNPNTVEVESVVKKLVSETFDKIIDGASEALKGADGVEAIGNVAEPVAGAGAGADVNAVKSLSEGIKKIVSVVLKEGNAEAGNDNGPVKDDGNAGAARGDAGAGADGDARKLFANNNAGDAAAAAKAARDAVKAVGAVTGADILQAIAKGDDGESAKLAKHNNVVANNNGANANNARDAIIAGGIALRAMAKGGKFANASAAAAGVKANVVNAAVSGVTKALNTLTVAIRSAVDEGLKSVKEAIKINTNDTPVSSENSVSGGQNK
ncbi:variable large family protein [Borrelia duttonii]|uniref:Variable large protein n=1 Tax=Borrelia duttonii (strain Ly) TaxID=412419 RepID=B5RP89_BORDL|nr:vlp protein, gamma subfamily [Borrelia duttonii Ly]